MMVIVVRLVHNHNDIVVIAVGSSIIGGSYRDYSGYRWLMMAIVIGR